MMMMVDTTATTTTPSAASIAAAAAAADDGNHHHREEPDEESAPLSQSTTTAAAAAAPASLPSSRQVLEWSVEDVSRWLAANSFSSYTELFCDRHQIDGRVLVSLSAEDLRAEPLHLTVFGDIKRLCMAIEVLREQAKEDQQQQQSSLLFDNSNDSRSGSGSNSGEEGGGGGVLTNGGGGYNHQSLGANSAARGKKRLLRPPPPPEFEESGGESETGNYQLFDAGGGGGGGGSAFEDGSPPHSSLSSSSSRTNSEDNLFSGNSSSLSSASSTVSLTSLSRCYSDDCLESLDGSPCQHVGGGTGATAGSTTSAIPLNVYVQQQGSSRAIQAQIIPTMASSAQLVNMAAYYQQKQQQQQQQQPTTSSGTYHQQPSSHHYSLINLSGNQERAYQQQHKQQQQQQQQQTKLINRKSAAVAANHNQNNTNTKQMKQVNSHNSSSNSRTNHHREWERYGQHGQHTSSTHHLQQAKHKKHHHHYSHSHHHHHHRDDDHHFKPERWKAIVAMLYFFASTWVTAIVMVIVHDRVPDMDTYPPLPDILLDNLPLIPWAFGMCEFCGVALFTIWIAIIIFHKHRFILLRRMFSLFGSVFLLRCVTMLITSLSVPGRHLECKARPYGNWMERIHQAYLIWQGGGMSIQGVRTCGDYMFSGHTVVLTLMNFFITEYTPTKLYLVHTVSWVLNLFGIFFILAAHEHYSIDVFIAFYISTRLFLYYHTLANNRALYQRDRHRTRIWFPLFYFFESSVNGIVPNTYDVPWRGCQELLVRYLADKFSAGFAFGVPGLYSAGGNGSSGNFLSIAVPSSEEGERKPLISAGPSANASANKSLETVDSFEAGVTKTKVKKTKKGGGTGAAASSSNSNGGNFSSASSFSSSSSGISGGGGSNGGGSGNTGRLSANGSVANSSKVKTQ